MLSDKIKMQILEELPVILDIQDLMNYLHCSQRTVYRMIEEKQINAFKDEDNEWNILRDDLIEYLDENLPSSNNNLY